MLKKFKIVNTPEGAAQVANTLVNTEEFALDLETTGFDFNRDIIHGVALANREQEWYVTLGAEQYILDHLKSLVKGRVVLGHNIMFDSHFLRKRGVYMGDVIDTMIAQFLVDENQQIGLKKLATTKLGHPPMPDFGDLLKDTKRMLGMKRVGDVTIYDVPLHRLASYAGMDVRLTLDLWETSKYELEQQGLLQHFFEVEMPFLNVLTEVEEAGFFIDKEVMAKLSAELVEKRDAVLDKFKQISGVENPNSGDQVAEYLYGVMKYKPTLFTDSGKPSTDVVALHRLLHKDKNGAIAALLEYRKVEKIISTYITSFQEKMYGDRLYGRFNPTGAVTGRLSSSDPNLQNIPSKGEEGSAVRELFAAPPGRVFIDADYSQLELRLLAHYTRDVNMMEAYANNEDIHDLTLTRLRSLGYELQRRDAKAVNFGWAYGIGPVGLQNSIERASGERPDKEDTAAWIMGFEKAYPGAKSWKYRVLEYARKLGYIKTVAGRRRHLPDLNSQDKALRGAAERQAINAIIQGSAADVTKFAMVMLLPIVKEYGALMTAQVHDEITMESDEGCAEDLKNDAKQVMESATEHFNLRVKLVSEPAVGPNWASTH